jgi:arylsulfatase A-like enzyme
MGVRELCLGAAAAVALAVAPPVFADAPVRCEGNPAAPGCCAQTEFRCDADTVSPVDPARKNILLLIADDLGYCHYGFMGPPEPGKFRLDELTCRNRYGATGRRPNGQFPYDRSKNETGTPRVITPALDDLAEHGAVFTRTHVAGVACIPSRRTLMLGRYQRHVQALIAYSDGSHECQIAPHGCISDADCPDAGDFCRPVRTLPRVLDDATGGDYESFAIGKLQFLNPVPGFDETDLGGGTRDLGQYHCLHGCTKEEGCCASCQECLADLAAGRIPEKARTAIAEIPDFIERRTIVREEGPDGIASEQTHPFFVWYGPSMPHGGPKPEPFFVDLYADSGLSTRNKDQFARISWYDSTVATLVDYLRGSCVCMPGPNGPTKQSLFDNTVVFALADQGFLLPRSKGQPSENGHRTTMIVSAPGHRAPGTPVAPHVFSDQIAHVSDIMQTMLAYAGVPPEERRPYAYARDLRPFIENPALGTIRDLEYGERGSSSLSGVGGINYIENHGGMVGVCAGPAPGHGQYRPCVRDADCTFEGRTEGPCVMPDQPMGKRCVNRPDLRCDVDADCAPSNGTLCASNACVRAPLLGSFAQFDGAACGADADCLPQGVCEPLMMKAQGSGSGTGRIRYLWDIQGDPDQARNLLTLDRDYLGPCLRGEMENCLYRFRAEAEPYKHARLPDCYPQALCGPATWCGPAANPCQE